MPGSEMQDVDCGRSNQLPDSEIVIGDPAKKALLALLKPDHQKWERPGDELQVKACLSELRLQRHLFKFFYTFYVRKMPPKAN